MNTVVKTVFLINYRAKIAAIQSLMIALLKPLLALNQLIGG